MSSHFGELFRISTFGESHGGGVGVVIDGCPPRLALSRGRHPARPRPPPARPERHRHPAQGDGPLPHPLRRVRGPHARHAHRRARAQRGRAAGGVCRDGNRLPAQPRGLHLPGQVRHPQLAGRGALQRAGNDRPRGGGRGGEGDACARCGRDWKSSPTCAASTTWKRSIDPATVRASEVEANTVRCPDAGGGRGDGRADQVDARARAIRSAA